MKRFKAELNADWGKNIVITSRPCKDKETARKQLEEHLKTTGYGDNTMETIIVSLEEIEGGN